jgi:cytochrome c oxidase subunit II
MRSEHPILQMVVIAAIAAALLIVASFAIPWFPAQASKQSGEIDTLYHVLLIVSILIFVLVMTVAIYSVWRFRARPGDMGDGAPIHGNTRLEIIWVAIPFLIVAILAGYGAKVLADEEQHHPNELHVKVIGQQFTWHFQYENRGNFQTNTLYLPKNQPVRFDIVSKDVIHAFWVPAFRIQEDAVPGQTDVQRATPSRLGHYDLVCAELCGLGHATMRSDIYIVTPQRFSTWVAQHHPGQTVPGTSVHDSQ